MYYHGDANSFIGQYIMDLDPWLYLKYFELFIVVLLINSLDIIIDLISGAGSITTNGIHNGTNGHTVDHQSLGIYFNLFYFLHNKKVTGSRSVA